MSANRSSPTTDVWKMIATVLFSWTVGFYSNALLKGSDKPQEPQSLVRVVDDLAYIKEAIRMIFENEATILMYLKMTLRKQGVPLE